MLAPIIVLIASIIILYAFVTTILNVLMEMTCFWGRVMYRKLDKQEFDIKYSFKVPLILVFGAVCAVPGVLWSVIKLTTLV